MEGREGKGWAEGRGMRRGGRTESSSGEADPAEALHELPAWPYLATTQHVAHGHLSRAYIRIQLRSITGEE